MKNLKLIFVAVTLFATVSVSAFGAMPEGAAQPRQNELPQDEMSQVDSLQRRVAKLEKRAATWEKIKKHFNITGFVQAGYEWTDDASSFYIRRARVSFLGSIFEGRKGAKADYRLQVDFANSPKIVDCWIRYSPTDAIGIQLGEFKFPLTIENTDYAPPVKLEFIENSLIVKRLVRASADDVTGINSAGRDIGAQLYGSFIKKDGYNVINYNLAVFNGSGINRRDDNKSKDFVGRIMINPIRELTLGAYYQYGEGAYANPYISEFFVGGGRYIVLHRYGGGLAYDCKDFFVRGEYLGGKTGGLTTDGAYLAGGYKFLGKWTAVARIDYFDIDRYDTDREWNYTVGMNYMPWKYLRLQLNYTLINCWYAKGCVRGFQNNSHSLNVMVTAMF